MPLELGAFMHPTTADSDSNARPDADADTCAYGRRYLRVRRCLRNGQYL